MEPGAFRDELASFLFYGFVPRERPPAPAVGGPGAPPLPDDEPALIERGIELLSRAIADAGEPLHVVPLSGGCDSRLILAVLRAAGVGDRLVAATFGSPGTWDHDLGALVARAAGVRHVPFDLTALELTAERLRAHVEGPPLWTSVWDRTFNALVPEHFGPDAVYWTGYLANSVAGHWFEELPWDEACALFARNNRAAKSVDLAPPGFHPSDPLPGGPPWPESGLTSYEQLQVGVKYPSRLAHVLEQPGFDFRRPLASDAWLDFCFRLPEEQRRGERLYYRIMQRLAPDLFALPTKNKLGLPLDVAPWRYTLARARSRATRVLRTRFPRLTRRPAPKTNYLDLDLELRRRADLREIVRGELADLRRRALLDRVDVEGLWNDHEAYRANHGRALALLTSLELNLKARDDA